jgi:dnd system-associated protein 4
MSKAVNQKELFSGDHTVYWPERYEPVVEYLKNGASNDVNANSLYKLNVQVIVLAACIGLISGDRKALPDKDKRKEIPLSVFNNNDLTVFIHLIAMLSDVEPDISILKNIEGENRAIKIFEEYAAAGLQILSDKYNDGFVDTPYLFVTDLIKNNSQLIKSSTNSQYLPPEEEIRLF